MKQKTIPTFKDCNVTILYGTSDEFLAWNKKRKRKKIMDAGKTDVTGRLKSYGGMCGYVGVYQDRGRHQCIWVNCSRQSIIGRIGTLSHEAVHFIDNLEAEFCRKPDEKIPSELKARMVQTIVCEGTKLILAVEGKEL